MRFIFSLFEPPYVSPAYGTDDFGNEFALCVNVTIGNTGRYIMGPHKPFVDPLAAISFQCAPELFVGVSRFIREGL